MTTAFRVISRPTFRDMAGRFARADAELLAARRQEMRVLAGLTRDRVAAAAPRRTGGYANRIRYRTFERGGAIGFTLSAPQPLTGWITGGTRPHTITTRQAQALRFEAGGEVIYRRLVNHPGTRPNPFIARTLNAMQGEMDAALSRISTRWERALA